MSLSQNLPYIFDFTPSKLYSNLYSNSITGTLVANGYLMNEQDNYISDWDKVSNPALKNRENIPNPLWKDAKFGIDFGNMNIINIGPEPIKQNDITPLKTTTLIDEQA